MSGLHDKRKAVYSPRTSKPLAGRRNKRAEESARRAKRIKGPALPWKREVSTSSTARTSGPAHANRDEDVTTVYDLRNRQVVAPNTGKPTVPSANKSGIPSGRNPFALSYVTGFSGGESAYASQTLTCAKLGLEHYNSMNQEDEHELVEAVDSNAFSYIGIWMHVNFLAKPKGATSCDNVPKFFAEVKGDPRGNFSCASCVKMDPGLPTESGCDVCPPQIIHPAASKC